MIREIWIGTRTGLRFEVLRSDDEPSTTPKSPFDPTEGVLKVGESTV